MTYQENAWKLQKQIYRCPGLQNHPENNESCYASLPEEVKRDHWSPDAIFVGSCYGKIKDVPRILFIGNNPNSQDDNFGTLMSVEKCYEDQWEETEAAQFYNDYYRGKDLGIKQFRGIINDRPFLNHQEENEEEGWGIKRILLELFPSTPQILEAFACTNGVLCKGPGKSGNPDKILRNNCMAYYNWIRKTIKILDPEVIFIYSVPTWNNFSVENGVVDDEENLVPDVDYAYYPVIRSADDRICKPFTMAIPHLTTPKFQTWVNLINIPIVFRTIFQNHLDSENNVQLTTRGIIDTLIETIRNHINSL